MYYGFDMTYLLVLIGAGISAWAGWQVSSTFSKYARVRSTAGMTGAEVARVILDRNGLHGIRVERVAGNLTDHYDPSAKTVRLSDATYASSSVAAVGVAAHECGHAVQDKVSYTPLRIRTAIVPAANLGSRLGLPIVILSLVLGLNYIFAQIGIWLFMFGVAFQLVTLPVEFNASRRALQMLSDYNILSKDERSLSRQVLVAAALTYVAGALSALLQLLRLYLLSQRRRR